MLLVIFVTINFFNQINHAKCINYIGLKFSLNDVANNSNDVNASYNDILASDGHN